MSFSLHFFSFTFAYTRLFRTVRLASTEQCEHINEAIFKLHSKLYEIIRDDAALEAYSSSCLCYDVKFKINSHVYFQKEKKKNSKIDAAMNRINEKLIVLFWSNLLVSQTKERITLLIPNVCTYYVLVQDYLFSVDSKQEQQEKVVYCLPNSFRRCIYNRNA